MRKAFLMLYIYVNNAQMSGDRYIIEDQQATYFLTLTIANWIDLFTRKEYRDVIVESLNYCTREKGLVLNAWVIMSNHIHLVGRVTSEIGMSGFLRDFKKHTSKKFVKLITELHESRRDWLLDKFMFEAKRTRRAKFHKVWMDTNHAIDLSNNSIDIMNKINYIHMNPVSGGWVEYPDAYIYSSAIDYAGGKGLIKLEVV